jgi:ABC-2 type transport system ATP-binding protein
LTTQYLGEADELADRIAVIDHGRVIAQGTGDELKDQVGGQMIEVRLTDPADRERAHGALAALGCGDPPPSEQPTALTLPAPHDGVGMVAEAARALQGAGVAVNDLGLRRPTLDDVFLQLTGAPPTESGDGRDPEGGGDEGSALQGDAVPTGMGVDGDERTIAAEPTPPERERA